MKTLKGLLIIPTCITLALIAFSCNNSTKTNQELSFQVSNKSLDLSGKTIGWREDNRTGISSETNLLKSWPEGGPELVYLNTDLPEGHSSVAIGNNTIYLTGIDSENDVLVALDNTGAIKWQVAYGRSWDGSYPNSRCTPTIDGDKVYVSSGYGDLACTNATSGEIIWQLKASEMHKGTYGKWGIAESLIIDGDKLYYSPGGPETTTIALNKLTGELIWKSESLNDKAAYASPILVDYAGKEMLINVSLGHAYAVDVSNGDILWAVPFEEARWGDHIICVTPLYYEGRVYITEGYGTGGTMIEMADDGMSASVVWTDEVLDVHHGGVVLIDGYIYGSNWNGNGNGDWCCLDWNTGETKWEEHWNSKGSIISAEGMLYIYDEKRGNVGLLNATSEKFDLVSSFEAPAGSGPYWAHPVIHNGNLYLRHGEALMVYSIKS